MRRLLAAVPMLVAWNSATAQTPRQEIQPLLDEQMAAANAHDTDRFLAAYLRSPDLVFVFNGGIIKGIDSLRTQQLQWWRNGASDVVYEEDGATIYNELDSATIIVTSPLRSRRTGAALAPSLPVALSSQVPGRVEVSVLLGAAIPAGPAEFGEWRAGIGGSAGVGYRIAPRTDIGASFEYQHFGYRPDVFAPQEPPIRPDPGTSLWAAWLDATHLLALDPKLGARLHVGLGVVAMGAARTGLGLRVGAGLDAPISTHVSMIFDATFAHAFTRSDPGSHALTSPFSYAPLRAGVSWR